MDVMTGVLFTPGTWIFLFATMSKHLWGPSASYPKRYLGLFLRGKAAEACGWRLTQCNTEVNNAWSYISSPPYVFVAWYLVKHRNIFTSYPVDLRGC